MAARLTEAEINKLNKEFDSLSEDNDDEYKRKKEIWNILNFNKRLQGEASPKISDKKLTRLSERLHRKSLTSPKYTASGLEPRSLSKIEIPSRVWPQKKDRIKSPIGWEEAKSPSYDEQEMTGLSDGSMNLSREAVQRNLESQKNVDETGHISPAQKSWEKKRRKEQSPERALLEAKARGDILNDLTPHERETAEAAIRKRQRATNEGTTKDGPLTKEEAINSLRGGLKKGSGDEIPEQTEFSDDEGGFLLADQMDRAGKKISRDEFEQAKIKREQMADYTKMMQDDIKSEENTIASRTMGHMGALDDRSSDSIKEGLLSNINTRKSRTDTKSGMKEFLEKQPTSKQLIQRLKSQVGLNKATEEALQYGALQQMGRDENTVQKQIDDKRQWENLASEDKAYDARMKGYGLPEEEKQIRDMADWEMINEMNVQKEQARRDAPTEFMESYPTDFELAEMSGRAGESITPEQMAYDKSMEGDGEDFTTTVNLKRKVNADTQDIEEELIEQGITSEKDRRDVKMKAGNYVEVPLNSSSSALINLDRVQAEITRQEDREDLFKTAQLLQGEPKLRFLERKGLIDPKDIPPKTPLEEAEEKLKGWETKEKLAEILSRAVYKDGKVVSFKAKKGEKKVTANKLVDGAAAAFKEGYPELAYHLLSQAEIPGLNKTMFKKPAEKDDVNHAVALYGETKLAEIVGSTEPKDIASFLSKYRDHRFKVGESLAGIIDEESFQTASNKAKGYFDAVGIKRDGSTYREYARGRDKALANQLPLPKIKLLNPLTQEYYEMDTPEGGWKNADEFYTAAHRVVFDQTVRSIYPRFHDMYSESRINRGQRAVDEGPNGKTDGVGRNIRGQTIPRFEDKELVGIQEEDGGGDGQEPAETSVQNIIPEVKQAAISEGIVPVNPESLMKISKEALSEIHQKLLEATKGGSPGDGPSPSDKQAYKAFQINFANLEKASQAVWRRQNEFKQEPPKEEAVVKEEETGTFGPPKVGAAEIKQSMSAMILTDGLNEEFTFGKLTGDSARKGVENLNAFWETMKREGYPNKTVSSIKQEFYEAKDKNGNPKPVKSNGENVYHIGYGIRLPISSREADILNVAGVSERDTERLKLNPAKHFDKIQAVKLSADQAETLSKDRYANHIRRLVKANPKVNWPALPTEVRSVLFDMSYNLGPQFMTRKKDPFEKFKKALIGDTKHGTRGEPDINEMVMQIMNSEWFLKQNKNRAQKNIDTLRSI